jgi:NAD(P)H-hydrate repair Nnr-like enzyme with NAD(P)H-hydrate epimerase domain
VNARLSVACVTAAAALVGCGTQQLDTEEAEKTIGDRLGQQAKTKVTVDCPDDVELKKGDTFDCNAKSRTDQAKVKVTQLDDEGNVRWEVRGASD